ncbi:MAG: GHKL domain-containing protein [Clostridia bacterium]|nr:GHKL domain-containing protein [Clostridia bacterium]
MEGLSKYYKSLFNECKNLNNLSAINPEIINNPSIYAILADKYNKANLNNIQFELGVFIDLNSLHIDTYEFTRILGILLDNSIEAAQECSKKYINVRFLMDYRRNRQLVIVENTYNEKDIDTFKIFEKSYSTKPNNTGLGLWKVNKILNKHDNLAIFTSKDDELFKQQLEIYLPKPSLLKI